MKKMDINKLAIILIGSLLSIAIFVYIVKKLDRPNYVNVNESIYTTSQNSQYSNTQVTPEEMQQAIELIKRWANTAPSGWRYEIKQVNNNTIEYRLFTTKAYIYNMSKSEWCGLVDCLLAATEDYRLPEGINVTSMFCEIGVPDVYYYKAINGNVVHDPVRGIVEY